MYLEGKWGEMGREFFLPKFYTLYNSFKNVYACFDKKQNKIKSDPLVRTPIIVVFTLDFEQRWISCLEFRHY